MPPKKLKLVKAEEGKSEESCQAVTKVEAKGEKGELNKKAKDRGKHVDDGSRKSEEEAKNKKKEGVNPRCSAAHLQTAVEKIKNVATDTQMAAIKNSPFGHFLQPMTGNSSVVWLEGLLKCYNSENRSFKFGEGVELKFCSKEFSCVMGLQYMGQYVHPKCEQKSVTVERLFDGKVANVNRKKITSLFQEMAGVEEGDPEDFARIFILLVFNCLLFPTSSLHTLEYILNYVDDLKSIGSFAWGVAVYEYLVNALDENAVGKSYIGGCTIGLLVS